MTDKVVVNRDRTRLLPPNSPEKGWSISRKEAAALGLVKAEETPRQERRTIIRASTDGTHQRRRSGKRSGTGTGKSGKGRGRNQDT